MLLATTLCVKTESMKARGVRVDGQVLRSWEPIVRSPNSPFK